MIYPTQLLFLAAAFLVPNSQAVLSDNLAIVMEEAGYYCEAAGKITKVNIHYGESANNLPCKVTVESKGSEAMVLLEAKRNVEICEHKADVMKQRLIDRGWSCLSSGM